MTRSAIGCALALAGLALAAVPAAAQSTVRAGMLECRGFATRGFIVGSIQQFACTFRSEDGRAYPYRGVVRKVGLDVGLTLSSNLAWIVLAPTRAIGPGDLSGNYSGLTAGAAVGVGGNANALIGGSHNTIALQPLSVEGQTGFNASLAVADFELRYGEWD